MIAKSESNLPPSTEKRWKREGFRPAGRSALIPIERFVEIAKPLRGTGRPADVAMLKLAGQEQIGTAGLPDVLIRLTCLPEGASNPTGPDAPYHAVADLRKTVQGDRLNRNLKMGFQMDGPASLDLAEQQADDVVTAASLAVFGDAPDAQMVEELAQLYENTAAQLVGEEPEVASDEAIRIAESGLAALGDAPRKIIQWLTCASVDEMTDAIGVAAKLDEVIQLVIGGRDDRGDEEKWRGIGRMAPLVGINPQEVVAQMQLFEVLRDGNLILAPQDPASL